MKKYGPWSEEGTRHYRNPAFFLMWRLERALSKGKRFAQSKALSALFVRGYSVTVTARAARAVESKSPAFMWMFRLERALDEHDSSFVTRALRKLRQRGFVVTIVEEEARLLDKGAGI